MQVNVNVKALRQGAKLPAYGSPYAAGADLYACIDESVKFLPGETKMIPTGLAIELPVGCVALIYARSGLAAKRGVAPANKVGVVDCDYRGEVMVALHNHSHAEQVIEPQERIAQMVIAPYYTAEFAFAEELGKTVRGEGGFGSTGTK